MVQNKFDMITAVFDSSEDEDTLQPHEQSTLATQSGNSFTQTTTDTALSAELSNIAHEYEHSGESYADLQHNVVQKAWESDLHCVPHRCPSK